MAKVESKSRVLPKKSRVVAVRDLRGVPAGTGGRVKVVNGLTWPRYWVAFDNDVWLGSVDTGAVIAEDEWPEFQERTAAEAARAAAEPAAAAAVPEAAAPAAPAAADAGSGAASKIPAHLLARSQAAKAKKPA
jgi:hypothetical protein